MSYEYIKDLPILEGKGFVPKICGITIEISGRCNAKCIYCARQRFNQRFAGNNMSLILFKQILNHLIDIKLLQKNHTNIITLYNWGEPFLNPNFNDILTILKNKNLRANISSNFIIKPKINNDNLSTISDITLSLSGFSQKTYGKIHGASLDRVLNNFESVYKKMRKHSPNTKIHISWHRYKFNEKEFWKAYKYFNRPGINFIPTVAFLNDLHELLNYTTGKLSKDRLTQAKKDIFLEHISKELSYHKKRSKGYHCALWNDLVIDENGELILCCNVTNNDSKQVLGHILKMSINDIWYNKLSNPLCKPCISSGIPKAFSSMIVKPLPPGNFKFQCKLYFKNIIPRTIHKIVEIVKNLPGGKKVINQINSIRG